jgi:hypothetical protein
MLCSMKHKAMQNLLVAVALIGLAAGIVGRAYNREFNGLVTATFVQAIMACVVGFGAMRLGCALGGWLLK